MFLKVREREREEEDKEKRLLMKQADELRLKLDIVVSQSEIQFQSVIANKQDIKKRDLEKQLNQILAEIQFYLDWKRENENECESISGVNIQLQQDYIDHE